MVEGSSPFAGVFCNPSFSIYYSLMQCLKQFVSVIQYLAPSVQPLIITSAMTSQQSVAAFPTASESENLLECPICLATLVVPITLTCGHTFCEPCIKSKYFTLVKHVCPLCRKPIACNLNKFSINVLLDQLLMVRYSDTKSYLERVALARQAGQGYNESWGGMVRRWVRQKLPWIIILVLLYHLLKVKMNFFSFNFKDYKDKALQIANSIKVENSLDFKFLLFSQFMRLLFSTIIIP